MAIKNYTTKVPADKSIQEIQNALVSHGAIGFMLQYEKGTGRIQALQFVTVTSHNDRCYSRGVGRRWCY